MDENMSELATVTENTSETADLVSAEMNGETTPGPIALPFGIEPGSERYWAARVDDRRLIFRRGLLASAGLSFAVLQKRLGDGFTLTDRTIVGKLDNGAYLTIAQVHADNKTRWQFTLVTAGDPV